jgi:hypothetical protein
MSKKALKKTPEEKNPYLQIGYVKTIYFAYLWMKNRGLNKLNRFRTESSRFSLVALMADIEKADNKIEERQAEGEKLIKKIHWIAKPLGNDSLVCYRTGKKRGYFNMYTGEVVIEPSILMHGSSQMGWQRLKKTGGSSLLMLLGRL